MSPPSPPARSRSRPARQLAVFSIHSTIFLSLISLRILNAVTLRTFFQPDEYFQSLEPAWSLAFGSSGGADSLTWEWRHGLRSIAHPMLFAGLYRAIASVCSISALYISPQRQAEVLVIAPRILQALCAAMGDWATARLAGRLWGSDVGWISFCMSLGSAWQWFCGVRTFANSLETVLTAVALSVWPWTWATADAGGPRTEMIELRLSLFMAAIACVLRPTNVLIWAFLGLFALRNAGAKRAVLITQAAWIGAFVLVLNALLDHAYYGYWAFPPLTFLKFNVLHSFSGFYGHNDWHYYLSQGLPLLLTSFLPLALHALYTSVRTRCATSPAFQLSVTALAVVAVYSTIAHKEARFLYPLLPMLNVLSAKRLHDMDWTSKTKNRVLAGMILLNLPIAYYGSLVHQRGVVDVMEHLGTTGSEWTSVGFLMPCHSTPWKASMKGAGAAMGEGSAEGEKEMWALSCEPPLDLQSPQERDAYVDEADEFYADPPAFLQRHVGAEKRYSWPDRLVVFEALGNVWDGAGGGDWEGYVECWRGFNSHWHDDWRRRGDVVVYCRRGGL